MFRSVRNRCGCKVSQDFDFRGLLSEVCFVSMLSRRACSMCYYFGRNVWLLSCDIFRERENNVTDIRDQRYMYIQELYCSIVIYFALSRTNFVVKKDLYQDRYYRYNIIILCYQLMLLFR